MADLVMEIILAREIGGLESISENNWKQSGYQDNYMGKSEFNM